MLFSSCSRRTWVYVGGCCNPKRKGATGVELSTGTKLGAKQMCYFLGTENVNRISLKINLLVPRKDQKTCKAIADAQFSEQTRCGTKEERVLLLTTTIPFSPGSRKPFICGGMSVFLKEKQRFSLSGVDVL